MAPELTLFAMQRRLLVNSLFLGSRASLTKRWVIVLLAVAGAAAVFGFSYAGLYRMAMFTPLAKAVADKVFEFLIMMLVAALLLSSILNALSVAFLSNDLKWLGTLPLSARTLFFHKYTEVFAFSAWMVLIFGTPAFVAYGVFFKAQPLYYPLVLCTVVLLATIPVSLGMLLVTLLVNLLPARRFRDLLVLATLAAILAIFFIVRAMQPERLSDPEAVRYFTGAIVGLNLKWATYLPSTWAAEALRPFLRHTMFSPKPLWLLLISSTGLYILAQWTFEGLFFRGLSRALGSQPPLAARAKMWNTILSFYLWPWPRKLQSIAKKDILSMVRDSSQWSQILILGAVVIIYVVNVQAFPVEQMALFGLKAQQARNLLGFLSISLSGLVMAAIGARFLYTGVSLEGRSVWVMQSSPLSARTFLASKLVVGLPPCLGMGLVLTILTNAILSANSSVWISSLLIVPIMAIGIGGLGVGLGAIMPEFRAANPAKIVAGLGGMIYMVSSVFYVVLCTLLVAYPLLSSWRSQTFDMWRMLPFYSGMLVVTFLVTYISLRQGARRWDSRYQ